MKKIITIAFISCLVLSCSSSKKTNKLTSTEKNEGWQLLFDGKTTKGWHKYGNEPIGDAWKVKDGYLYIDSVKKPGQAAEGGDLVTDEEFDNFDLQLEWKISKNGNSGIIFFIKDDKQKYNNTWQTGMEMQVLDNDGHPDGKIIKHRAGDLYDLIKSSSEPVKPVGEWNLAEIKSLNGKLDLYLNGTNVVSTTLWDDNWKKLIAGSKFKTMPDFGTMHKGHIALQDHGNAVCFRNIKIRKL